MPVVNNASILSNYFKSFAQNCLSLFAPKRKKHSIKCNPWITCNIVYLIRRLRCARHKILRNPILIANLSSEVCVELTVSKLHSHVLTGYTKNLPPKLWKYLSGTKSNTALLHRAGPQNLSTRRNIARLIFFCQLNLKLDMTVYLRPPGLSVHVNCAYAVFTYTTQDISKLILPRTINEWKRLDSKVFTGCQSADSFQQWLESLFAQVLHNVLYNILCCSVYVILYMYFCTVFLLL